MTEEPDVIPPYIGLRAFQEWDNEYFCGRRAHIDQILERLKKERFLAVVGLSGAGKSSLIKAGVIPDLRRDRLKGSSSDWFVAMMTPEATPMDNLCASLTKAMEEYAAERESPPGEKVERWAQELTRTIYKSTQGLSNVFQTAELSERTQILIVVDQFEELFRFKNRTKKDEAEGFIERLLNASASDSSKIYVIITMRSGFLGHCARYEGLAEAVNRGLYLTPQLNSEQLEDAVTVPAQKGGRQIEPKLIRQLTKSANDRDQLPVLQHALMRCWKKSTGTITQDTYARIGGADALNEHADRVLDRLAENGSPEEVPQRRKIAEKLFKRITQGGGDDADGDEEGGGGRDAERLDVICRQIGYTRSQVDPVVDAFRKDGRAFLRPHEGKQLADDSMIDITHESLIRKWVALREWVQEEASAKVAYRDLVKEAVAAPDEYLTERKLSEYLDYMDKGHWSEAWAERYGGDYPVAREYVERSKVRNDKIKRKEQLRLKWYIALATAVGTLVAIFLLVMVTIRDRAVRQTLAFMSLANVAGDTGRMDERVPSGIGAFWLSQERDLRPDLAEQIGLDQWELFGALAKLDKHVKLTKGPGTRGAIKASGVAFDHDVESFAVADTKKIRVYTLNSPWEISSSAEFAGVDKVRFSRGGDLVATNSKNDEADNSRNDEADKTPLQVRVFSKVAQGLKEQQARRYALPNDISVIALTFVGNSNDIAVLTWQDATLDCQLFILSPNKRPYSLHFASSPNRSHLTLASLSSDGRFLLIAYENGTGTLLSLDKPQNPVEFNADDNDRLLSAYFTEDGRVVTGSFQGAVLIRPNPLDSRKRAAAPVEKGGKRSQRTVHPRRINLSQGIKNTPTAIQAVALRTFDDGDWIAVGAGNMAYVYGPEAEYAQSRPLIHQNTVTWVDFGRNSGQLLTASLDQKVRMFETRTGTETIRIPHQDRTVFARMLADGDIFSLSADGLSLVTRPDPYVRHQWFDGTCTMSPQLSAISEEDWFKTCGNELRVLDGNVSGHQTTAATPQIMYFSGTDTLVWMDVHPSGLEDKKGSKIESKNFIHFARKSKKGEWVLLPPAWSLPDGLIFGSGQELLATSTDGKRSCCRI